MKAIIQRVTEAYVEVDRKKTGAIKEGILVFLGIATNDTEKDVKWLAKKITDLRIFNNDKNIMDLSVKQINKDILVVSQFTIMGNAKKGNRPSYIKAASPNISKPLYDLFLKELSALMNKKILSGIFRADMKVFLINDGPVTIILDSKE